MAKARSKDPKGKGEKHPGGTGRAETVTELLGRLSQPALTGKYSTRRTLTRDRRELIVAVLRTGSHREIAAALAGIPLPTLEEWLEKGRDGHASYSRFLAEVEAAEAEAEALLAAYFFDGASRAPDIARRFLEARHPNRWHAARRGGEAAGPEELARRIRHMLIVMDDTVPEPVPDPSPAPSKKATPLKRKEGGDSKGGGRKGGGPGKGAGAKKPKGRKK